MITFDDTKIAFGGKSSRDLKRAYWLFKIVASPLAVKFGKWAVKIALALHLPIKGLIKKTIFKQFCGGESIGESLKTSDELAKYKVETILDYSVEGKTKEDDFDQTVKEIISTIDEAKKNPNIPFAVFKVTGICSIEVLKKANLSDANLSETIQSQYNDLITRVDKICAAAFEGNIPLFIDAEESWIQNTIDRIVREMSFKYNQSKAIVFNTAQLYRHDRLKFIETEIDDARNRNYFIGMKLVRGAYMEKERDRAEKLGYPSPIHDTKENCDKDFNSALSLMLKNKDIASLCAGTHNEESCAFLANQMEKLNMAKNDSRVYFAQLLGMSDHISYNLADKDYKVAKYVPYGPIKEVLPYLIRRAEENTSVAGQTSRELSLIRKERKRRQTS